jgi:hypothetical protein
MVSDNKNVLSDNKLLADNMFSTDNIMLSDNRNMLSDHVIFNNMLSVGKGPTFQT